MQDSASSGVDTIQVYSDVRCLIVYMPGFVFHDIRDFFEFAWLEKLSLMSNRFVVQLNMFALLLEANIEILTNER